MTPSCSCYESCPVSTAHRKGGDKLSLLLLWSTFEPCNVNDQLNLLGLEV